MVDGGRAATPEQLAATVERLYTPKAPRPQARSSPRQSLSHALAAACTRFQQTQRALRC
jgi:hypothetical protein